MRSLPGSFLKIAWSAVLALFILGFGQGVWGVLLVGNLKTTPTIPWAVPVMAVVLWLMWRYLGGQWLPRSYAYVMGGAVDVTNEANATATFTFTSTDVAWISALGTDRGHQAASIAGEWREGRRAADPRRSHSQDERHDPSPAHDEIAAGRIIAKGALQSDAQASAR